MSVDLWRIAAVTPAYPAQDLSGTGAKISGGRWNRPGNPVVYTATNIALATLETVVHFNTAMLPLNRILVRITVPDDAWEAANVLDCNSPRMVGWDVHPAGLVSLDAGDAWLASNDSLLLRVPSVLVPEEENVLINPAHPDIAKVTAKGLRVFQYDHRLKA